MGNQLSEVNEYGRKTDLRRLIPPGLRSHLAGLDRTLLKGSVVISIGMLVARGLAFVFYLILARAFAPGEYGEIQYALAIAEIIAIGTQPFGQHVLARFVGIHKESPDELRRFLSNAWTILTGLLVITFALAIPALVFLSLQSLGVLVVVAGTSIFYAYWGLARGFLASGRLVVAYLASNLLQLILTFWFIQVLGIKSVPLALVIYGGSYLLPLLLLQIVRPLFSSFDRRLVSWNDIKPILRFSLPIWLSHAMYMLSLTIDILLLRNLSDAETLGQYALAKNISVLFFFVPSGISTVLMPRVASLPEKQHKKLLIQSLALAVLINLGILAALLLFGAQIVSRLFGAEYLSSPATVLALSAGMIVFGIHAIISSVQVGKGFANRETISRFIILLTFALVGWSLIPLYGALGAAISVLAGGISGIAAYGILFFWNRRSS
jgi:O-antigen/teichoic acid export membrane protein